jgi:tetratricopeptide (TPR) repeat protein
MARIGPYLPLEEIGSGGMARVHLAEDERGARVALKVVHTHLAEDPSFLKRFRREGELGKRIHHRNVVGTLDVGRAEEGGKPVLYLALEYVKGQTLRGLLEELQRVPEELCRHIGREVAKGLEAIHAQGAIHRDLKPENILITDDHVVKVSDLGIARLVHESLGTTEPGVFAGTVLYAAPEQFGGKYDARADLYALGVVLYELATGTHPFAGDDPVRIMGRHLNEEPRPAGELNPQLSAFFEELLKTLLAKDPPKRIPSAAALLRILEEGEGGDWWAARARAVRTATRRPLRRPRIPRETVLIGREDEILRLRAAYDRAKAGEGQIVLVEGEAGIGKTRLCDEFVAGLAAEGEEIHYLFGAYLPGEAATASGAFSTAYREHLGAEGAATYLAGVPLLIPAFTALLRGEPAPAGAVPLTKDSLQAAFVEATRALAAEKPTVLLIDDLQFAPAEGRALLMSLAIAAPQHRILLLVTARPGIVPDAWTAELEKLPYASRIHLPRLGAKHLARLLVDAFHSEQLAEELGFKIARKSDGNPFFVFEIIRSLREGKLLKRRDDGTWFRTGVIEGISIPSSVRDLIQARMAELDAPDRDLLEAAACCGFEFDPTLVAEALSKDLLGALRRFGQIERRHRLIRSAGRRCVFDHHQVQETLYGGLLAQLKEQYHLALGDALERRMQGGPGGPDATALSEHFLKSADARRAKPYLSKALSHLERDYGADAPANIARLALEAPDLLAGRERVEMLLRFARNLDLSGKREEQRAALDEALKIAKGLSDAALGANVICRTGSFLLHTGRFEEARRCFDEALDLAGKAGDRACECVCCGGIGMLLSDTGRPLEALPWHERQLAIARETGNRASEANAINNIGNVHRGLHRLAEASADYERSLALARETNDRDAEAIALGNLGINAYDEGDIEGARRLHTQQLELSRAIGHRRTEARALGALAVDAKHLGLFDEAERCYERYIAISREIDHRMGMAYGKVNLARLVAREGDFEAARTLIAEAQPVLDEAAGPVPRAWARQVLGEIEAHVGQTERAARLLGEALDLLPDESPARTGALLALGTLRRDTKILEEALDAAVRLDLPSMRLAATCAMGDAREAEHAYEECAPRASCLERMDASYDLFLLTGQSSYLDTARGLLRQIEEHAPESRRATLRAHPLQARILGALPPGPPPS